MMFTYQMTLAGAWKLGGTAGAKIAQATAKFLGTHADPQHISSDMGYPYYIQWFGKFGSYKKAKNFKPECPMFFAYAKKKPFMFHSQKWADGLAAQPQNQVVAFNSGHWVQIDAAEQFNQQVGVWLAS
jgi:pimeloyl-ACP methyl ester carboxylesterase